jgi:hypothetical protein
VRFSCAAENHDNDDVKNKSIWRLQYTGSNVRCSFGFARSRFERGDEEAKDALEKISARESLIKSTKKIKPI